MISPLSQTIPHKSAKASAKAAAKAKSRGTPSGVELIFKRFLQKPMQVAYIVPSSRILIKKVMRKIDFSQPRVIVEYGPGDGCHTREMLRQMTPDSRLLLIEIDPLFTTHLREQFRDDPRVEVINTDAARITEELAERGIPHCDYVISGIPFSYLDTEKKRAILDSTFQALAPNDTSAFIIYQVTNELKSHARQFAQTESEWCIGNIPPMFVTKYYRQGPLRKAPHDRGH